MGQLVSVPLQNKLVLGIVEGSSRKPAFVTKLITKNWAIFLPEESRQLLQWLSVYYPAPLGMITELFTPPNMPNKLPANIETGDSYTSFALPSLTKEQTETLDKIDRSIAGNILDLREIVRSQSESARAKAVVSERNVSEGISREEKQFVAEVIQSGDKGVSRKPSILLHGDTGTGKTRLYVELATQTLQEGKSVIILTPEIGLTQPMVDTFTTTFGKRVLVTHSGMTPAQRRAVWIAAATDNSGVVIIGPRSALFTPLKRIGLIVMDEAHDSAYKQEQAPYYQTSRVAAQLARLHDARFIMGTATPLITDYFAFENKKLPILRMTKPAIKNHAKTDLKIIDLRDKNQFTGSSWMSNSLLKAMEQAIKNNEQSLLFLNRRGSARLVLCSNCGWQAVCPHCDVALTYHQDNHVMRCHSCEYNNKVPTTCPQCTAGELIFRSIGTKAIELEVKKLFPEARVARFDRDTEKAQNLQAQYKALRSGNIDILIGTQTIAKGFDLPKLSVVGVIQADSGLQIPDYSATEKTYQLLSQVSGRIGRGHRAGTLLVQTFDPQSPLIQLALEKNYYQFYTNELKQRQLYNFPPFSYLLKITCARTTSKAAITACQKIAKTILTSVKAVDIEGPSPRFIEKMSGRYAWHLVIKSRERKRLLEIINILPSNTTYDLDPSDLL